MKRKNYIPESLSAWDEIKRNSWWSIAELEHRSIEQNASSVRISLKWPQVTYIKNKMFKARFQNVYSYVKKLKMEIISSSSKFNIVIEALTQTTWSSQADRNVLILRWRSDWFLECMGYFTLWQLIEWTYDGSSPIKWPLHENSTTSNRENFIMRVCNFLIFAFLAGEGEATLKMYGNYLYLGQTTEQKSETNFNPEYMAIKYDFKYRERQISILGEGKRF